MYIHMGMLLKNKHKDTFGIWTDYILWETQDKCCTTLTTQGFVTRYDSKNRKLLTHAQFKHTNWCEPEKQ